MRPFRLESVGGHLSDKAPRFWGAKSALAIVSSVLTMLCVCGVGTLAGISTAAAVPVPWHIATSPDTSASENNYINDVSCTSSTSCVAVGYYTASSGFDQALIETLSGGSWSITTSPDTFMSELNGVSCTSSTSCVAVGYYRSSFPGYPHTLVETLSGGSWSITTSPDTSTSEGNQLNSVSCTSSTSCVAVGYYTASSSSDQTLIETLSGTTWSITTSPDTSTSEGNDLVGVSCTSSTSCVAVGSYAPAGFPGFDQTLIETLSDGSWTITTSPDTSTSEANDLYGVSCTSSTSCVAVGATFNPDTEILQNLIETLSGGSWSITTSPDTSTSEDNLLNGVSCTSSTSCVVVGSYVPSTGNEQNLIETLSGGSWSITTSPDTSTSDGDLLNGVSCTSSTSCAAVGYYVDSSTGYTQTLILSTPVPQTITFSPPPPTSVLFGSTLTLNAMGGGSGNPVTFTDTSPDVCSITSTEETSTPYQVTVVFISAGTCVIEADQAGNNDYLAAPEVTVTISVTYSEPCLSLSGYHGLNVRTGQAICTSPGAVIRGPITVQPGGSLDIEGAGVYGPITSNGAGVVRICDSKINGSVSISSSTGPVIIGDEGIGCSRNTINGPVNITNNMGGVTVDDNTVNGPATITGNSPSLAFIGNTVTGTMTI
jgi:hypothetical protein